MKKLKQFLALLLALCMTVGNVPFHALATGDTDPIAQETEAVAETAASETEAVETEQPTDAAAESSETEAATEPVESGMMLLSLEDGIATAALTMGDKPKDGTVTGEPFDTSVSKNYRIPGLVKHNDTLVAVADARYNYEYDGGGSDIVVSRSEDNGATWSYSFVAYLGDNGNVHDKTSSTLMDPLIVTDGTNLYLFYDFFPAGYSLSGGNNTTHSFWATGTGFDDKGRLLLGTTYNSDSCGYYLDGGKIYTTAGAEVAGYTVDEWFNVYQNGTYVSNLFFCESPYYAYPTSYICMQTSSDGGKSWSDPELLNIKHDGTKWQVLGPGSGLITSDGQIAFTVYNSDSSISLVYGTEGSWNTVKTGATTNESSIVELSDGTIRAFVKNSNNVITYVDFTKNGSGYTAGSAKSTGISNTGWCMISSMMYSKQVDGQDVIFVCCPSSDGLRRYGTVYAFKLSNSNEMTLLKSYKITTGYNDQFFAYSDMEELADGSIAMLYEDGCLTYTSAPWNGSPAGIGYSHIAFINLDPVNDMGITFDKPSNTLKDNATDITVTAPDLTRLEIEKLNASTPAEGYNRSVTYSIKMYDSEDNKIAGSATVKLPVGELAGCLRYTGSVDGEAFTVGEPVDGYFTVYVPHFSDVTISGYALDPVTLDIEVYEGNSTTVPIDGAAYSENSVTTSPDSTIAVLAQITGTSGAAESELVPVQSLSDIVSGEKYVFVNKRSGNVLADTTGYASMWYTTCLQQTSGPATVDSTAWTITIKDGFYYVQSSAGSYITISPNASNLTTTETALTIHDYGDGTLGLAQNGNYLNDMGGYGEFAGGYDVQADAGAPWYIYRINENEADAQTEVTITGVSAGTTTATVGHVTYNITVLDREEIVENITLYVGESKTFTIEDATYTEANVTTRPNDTIATLDSVVDNTAVPKLKKITSLEDIQSGKQYIIENTSTEELLTNDVVIKTNGEWGDRTGLDTSGSASPSSLERWLITPTDDEFGYHIAQGDKYLVFSGYYAYMSDTPTTIYLTYTNEGWTLFDNTTVAPEATDQNDTNYYLQDDAGAANGYGGIALGSKTDPGNRYWNIYEIVSGTTDVTFTGVSKGTTTATVGHVVYNITVEDLSDAPAGDIAGLTNIVGTQTYDGDNGDVELTDAAINALTTAAGSSFQLGVDLADPDVVVWSTADSAVATVDESGLVTGVAEGETTITATVYSDGVYETITIPVYVLPSFGTGTDTATVCYYVKDEVYTDAYYSLYSTNITKELVSVTEGQVIYFQRPVDVPFAMIWLSSPDAGYALSYMAATGSTSEYHPLHTGDYVLKTDGNYYANSTAFHNLSSAFGCNADTVRAMLTTAVGEGYKCDGAMSMGRRANDVSPRLGTSLSFIANPLPTVEKKLNGVLPTSLLQADFRRYDGTEMYALVGEYVYFTIDVVLEAPRGWVLDDNGNETRVSATTYSASTLTDKLEDAYFYTKDLDPNMNGIIDNPNERLQTQDITNKLNAEWTDAEIAAGKRVLEFYVVYQITPTDLDEDIVNTVDLTYTYASRYSNGTNSAALDAKANIHVLGARMDDIVIDFGQPFSIVDTDDKFGFKDVDMSQTQCSYGKVEISSDNNTYTLTYTPTKILQTRDVVVLYNKEGKSINYFVVYPATTVFYEEGFLPTANFSGNWTDKGSEIPTQKQATETLGEHTNNYGYDSNVADNGTDATTQTLGAYTSFQFTGTGVEIYANCTESTGYVSVELKNEAGVLQKIYMVNTAVGAGSTDATIGQTGSFNSLPIVSIRDLDHGTYTVTLRKIMDSKEIHIDGFRIINTIADSSIFTGDLEDNPEFYELRDMVLNAIPVGDSEQYGPLDTIVDQVYNKLAAEAATLITDEKVDYAKTNTVQDLLDNGPKNELFLYADQTLSFKVKTSRVMQLGLKAPQGDTSYQITGVTTNPLTGTISKSTDMFYKLGNEPGTNTTYLVSVKNTGDAVLSVTTLKICDDPDAAFVPLTKEDIEIILTGSSGSTGENPEPETPEETEPEETQPEVEETEPEPTEPEVEVTEPTPTEPEPTEPEETQPEPTEPEMSETEQRVSNVFSSLYNAIRQFVSNLIGKWFR